MASIGENEHSCFDSITGYVRAIFSRDFSEKCLCLGVSTFSDFSFTRFQLIPGRINLNSQNYHLCTQFLRHLVHYEWPG